MLPEFANSWWPLLLRGICAILFGVMAFIWPGLSLLTLVFLYGAYALVDGVFALFAAAAGRGGQVPTWWLVLVGLLGIGVGFLTFLWPGITAFALLVMIAVWAIIKGIFEIAGAIALRKHIENEGLLILAGLASVAFGVLLLIAPGAGALALVWFIAFWAVVFGVIEIALAMRLRGLKHHVGGPAGLAAGHA